jgi:hypothetical protein
MKQEIERMAELLEFGIYDLLHPKMYLYKKYIMIKKLYEKYSAIEIAYVFQYSSAQSVYSAIRNVDEWMQVDKVILEMWEGLK